MSITARIKALVFGKKAKQSKPSASIADHMAKMGQMARSMPPKNGAIPEGDGTGTFGKSFVLILFDEYGRAFQIRGAKISGGTFSPVYPARTAVMEMMDELGTSDFALEPGALEE